MAEYGNGSSSGGGGCCKCCCCFILTSGLTAIFMWLSLRTSNPDCSIEKFYVPALNMSNTNSTTANSSIIFDVKLDNGMKNKGVRYANISLSFFYNSSTLPVANYTVRGFYQGHKKNTHRCGSVEAIALPWAAAMDAVSNGSTVSFRVKLATRVKFKIMFWHTKRRRLEVTGDVVVDGSGKKVNRKNVKLKSGAGDVVNGKNVKYYVVVLTFIFILFL